MRISDWSSDVCSSDLRGSGPTATDNYNVREDWRQENREDLEDIRQNNRIGLQTHRKAGQRAPRGTPTYRQANPAPARSGARSSGAGGEIGRAACRDRVWLDESISAVAEYLNKQ